jgi:hypothetical protein
MTVAVKPTAVALALCWHVGSRLTSLGTHIMRVAAAHGHVPKISDDVVAKVQDWRSAIRTHHGSQTRVAAVDHDAGEITLANPDDAQRYVAGDAVVVPIGDLLTDRPTAEESLDWVRVLRDEWRGWAYQQTPVANLRRLIASWHKLSAGKQ